jgi:hypothetical protein
MGMTIGTLKFCVLNSEVSAKGDSTVPSYTCLYLFAGVNRLLFSLVLHMI